MPRYQTNVVAALRKITALGRQLVIVDVQKCFPLSESIVDDLVDYAKGFDEIIYVWDMLFQEDPANEAGEGLNNQMFRQMKDSQIKVKQVPIEKQYGFLRSFMDLGFDDEEIIALLKFMLDRGIYDSRDLGEDDIKEEHKADFQKLLDEYELGDWDTYDAIFIPEDLLTDLRTNVKQRPLLVGGGREECLKEIYLLMEAMGFNPEINEQYTY